MPNVRAFAFFDVDETLISVKSMFSFFRFWCQGWTYDPELWERFQNHFESLREQNQPRTVLNREYYRFFAGVRPDDLAKAGEVWLTKMRTDRDDFFVHPTLDSLKTLAASGVEPVMVSGSFPAVLRPLARELGVSNLLCTHMQVDVQGAYTGEISPPQTIGHGKATAIYEFLNNRQVSAARCWAFGDDTSDLPMLEAVGKPVVVGEGGALVGIANNRAWQVIGRFAAG